ncbi:MAG: PAS domain-containing sensor histidine kinase [Parvibaculaceae bacterium]|nr:PAS domain-containing sensor histidine kinase [Parvibaculaceae bacterium]
MASSEHNRPAGWDVRLWNLASRRGKSGLLAIGFAIAAIALGTFTYMLLTGLTPFQPTRALLLALLVANLAVVFVLFALISWRVAKVIIARASGSAGAKLHSRLVATFAILAVTPAIIVAVFAAVTLNRGLDFWFTQRAQLIMTNAQTVAEAYLREHKNVMRGDVLAMATDLNRVAPFIAQAPQRFQQYLGTQAALRALPAVYIITDKGQILYKATANIAPELSLPSAGQFREADKGDVVLFTVDPGNQIRALEKLSGMDGAYLYVARFVDARVLEYIQQTQEAVNEYDNLQTRRFTIQVTFALIYVAVAMLVLMAAIWMGLWAANRIVEPIIRLVLAHEHVSAGDLSARVEVGQTGDELDMLSRAFNKMTSQLESQRNALVEANHQLDQRRQFTEAVLFGVSAGVIGLDAEGQIHHANRAARNFLEPDGGDIVGRNIADVAPRMLPLLKLAQTNPRRYAQDQIVLPHNGQDRTLNLRITNADSENADSQMNIGGYVLTFDDITELVMAQRTSAWADVARRIAHEIKNPLTPIQLSAERLKRKYAKEIVTDPEIFQQCTDTIIRQVSDIGRMVDEFSSFARMPSAVFKPTEINEIVRQAVFLQRVGHPEIAYTLRAPAEPVEIDCDGRLVSQALTNILKNAAEAIRGNEDEMGEDATMKPADHQIGKVNIDLIVDAGAVTIMITDSGRGLPETDRLKLTEPYITTRSKGTGLGLAIVKKVMEDHGGTLVLEDAPRTEGWTTGARVRLVFMRRAGGATPLELRQNGETVHGV